MDNENITLYVELDAQEVEVSIKEITKALSDLKKLASGFVGQGDGSLVPLNFKTGHQETAEAVF